MTELITVSGEYDKYGDTIIMTSSISTIEYDTVIDFDGKNATVHLNNKDTISTKHSIEELLKMIKG